MDGKGSLEARPWDPGSWAGGEGKREAVSGRRAGAEVDMERQGRATGVRLGCWEHGAHGWLGATADSRCTNSCVAPADGNPLRATGHLLGRFLRSQ